MLDMSVRAKILDLMIDLKTRLGLTYVYVTHDLAGAKFFCDRVAIMYLGRIVEIGTVDEIFHDPKHPYTQALIRAIPEPDPDKALPRDLPRGEIPDAARPPLGCSFHPRCPKAFDICGWESRDLRAILEERWVEAGEETYATERPLVGDLDKLDDRRPRGVRPGRLGQGPRRAARDARADPRRGARRAAVEGRQGDDRRDERRARELRAGHRPAAVRHGRRPGRLPALQALIPAHRVRLAAEAPGAGRGGAADQEALAELHAEVAQRVELRRVSMPSAMTSSSSLRASSTITPMKLASRPSPPRPSTNGLAIFRLSSGSEWR